MDETPTPVSELTSDEIVQTLGTLWTFIVDANQQMARCAAVQAQWAAAKAQWKARWEDLCHEHRRRVAPNQPPVVWGDPTERVLEQKRLVRPLSAQASERLREAAYRTNEKRWGYKETLSDQERIARRRARVARWKARRRAAAGAADVL